jgi:hypothetical protein
MVESSHKKEILMKITMEQVGTEYHIKNKDRVIAAVLDKKEAERVLEFLKNLEIELDTTPELG